MSIEALRSFLINFLKTLPGGEDLAQFESKRQEEEIARQRPPQTSRPTNTHNAKAVRAYQSMAMHADQKKDTEEEGLKSEASQEPTADLLKSKELRDIHALIDDLEVLKRASIDQLHIQKAETFLDALKNSVRLQKSKI